MGSALSTFSARLYLLMLFFLVGPVSAQKEMWLKVDGASEVLTDDYGNFYIYRPGDFTFIKYDSLGREQGRVLFTVPFRIQSVQNPLSIPAFSENAQEIRYFDSNLIPIQTVDLRQRFGHIPLAYAENPESVWLLDESTKRLVNYNLRDQMILNNFPIDFDFENMLDFVVFEGRAYLLFKDKFQVYQLNNGKSLSFPVSAAKRFRRENKVFFVLGTDAVFKYAGEKLERVFSTGNGRIVDKNYSGYFVITENKLYLYPL